MKLKRQVRWHSLDVYKRQRKGYGVITPSVEDIKLDEPELIHHGNKFGVKLRATSPSIHLIQADIETEIAPIVGTKEQAEDLVRYIAGGEDIVSEDGQSGIWDTNIFGKTVRQLVCLLYTSRCV